MTRQKNISGESNSRCDGKSAAPSALRFPLWWRHHLARCNSISKRFVKELTGTAAVEAAFVLPLVLAVTIFICEFGRVLYAKAELQHAVFNASRYGMVVATGDENTFRTKLEDAFILLDPASVQSVSLSETVNTDTTRTTTISVAYRFEFMLHVFSDPINLSSSMTFLRSPQ